MLISTPTPCGTNLLGILTIIPLIVSFFYIGTFVQITIIPLFFITMGHTYLKPIVVKTFDNKNFNYTKFNYIVYVQSTFTIPVC